MKHVGKTYAAKTQYVTDSIKAITQNCELRRWTRGPWAVA